jgi:lipid A 3-O-deacylase
MSAPAAAQESALVFGAGVSGMVHHNTHVQHTVEIASMEYRSSYELFSGSGYELLREIKPLVGAFATSDGSGYVHAGAYRDFALAPRWVVTPHLSAGAYAHGSKNNLGGKLEFQSGVDLFYRLDRGWRVGATLRHVSNAGTGDFNPGIETLAVLVSVPLR